MSSTPYDRQESFALFSAENPSEPHSGTTLDAEFNAVKVALDDTQQNLALIQDDDGALKRGSVGQAQLDSSVSIGFGAPSLWQSDRIYTAEVDTVFYQSKFYISNTTHTSGVSFEASNWDEIADFTLAAVIDDGSITSAKLADGAVSADKIADGSISNSKMATGAVTTNKIADLNVTTPKIADASITLAKLAAEVLPAGLGPLPWSGRTAPTGWVLTGATYSRTTYPALWAHAAVEIGNGDTFYGVGDGLTTFTIASMAGYTVAGREAAASRLTATHFGGDSTKVGSTGGSESNTLDTTKIPSHTHVNTLNDPGHNHTVTPTRNSNSANAGNTNSVYPGSVNDLAMSMSANTNTTGITITNAAAGGGGAHANVQPTRIVEFIVKAH